MQVEVHVGGGATAKGLGLLQVGVSVTGNGLGPVDYRAALGMD